VLKEAEVQRIKQTFGDQPVSSSVASRCHETIRSCILEGVLGPGTVLSEGHLAAILSTSRPLWPVNWCKGT